MMRGLRELRTITGVLTNNAESHLTMEERRNIVGRAGAGEFLVCNFIVHIIR